MSRPFSMNVTLTIRPERRAEFLDAMREALPHARGGEACVYLNVGQSLEDPNVFINSEALRGPWRSRRLGPAGRYDAQE